MNRRTVDLISAASWHVLVRAHAGAGEYQLTATTFAAASLACPGDCGGDSAVTVDEVLLGVNISLGASDLAACPSFDANLDGAVSIDEMIAAVTSALAGCAG